MPHPTFFYLKLSYGSVTLELPTAFPLASVIPLDGVVSSTHISTGGKQERLLIRDEAMVQVVMEHIDGPTLSRLKSYFDNHASAGGQCELWLDQYSGSRWDFANTLSDQNWDVLTVAGSEAYNDSSTGRAFDMTGSNVLSRAVTDGVHLSKSQGVLTVRVKPDWAGNDSALHYFLDCGASASVNRLSLYKSAANNLVFEIKNSGGTSKTRSVAVSWSSGTEQEIIARYQTDGTMDVWLNGTQVSGGSAGSGGTLAALGGTLFVGSDLSSANKATGDIDLVAAYQYGFDAPTTLMSHPVETRTYFSKAELQDVQFLPSRMSTGAQKFSLTWTWRQGV